MRLPFTLVALLLSQNIFAEINILQSESLAGKFSGTDGRAIQLHFIFNPPLVPGDNFSLSIGDLEALAVNNSSIPTLSRFTSRFKIQPGETVKISINSKEKNDYFYNPKVVTGYTPQESGAFSPKINTVVATTKISSMYDVSIGDCLVLITGVDNTKNKYLSSISIKTDTGSLDIKGSPLLANSPFFATGKGGVFNKCEASIDQ